MAGGKLSISPRPSGLLVRKPSMSADDAASLRLPARLRPPKPYLLSLASRLGLPPPRPPGFSVLPGSEGAALL